MKQRGKIQIIMNVGYEVENDKPLSEAQIRKALLDEYKGFGNAELVFFYDGVAKIKHYITRVQINKGEWI